MNYVISIFSPAAFPKLKDICSELELPFNTALHGEGTAMPSMLDMLGIESNERRIMLSVAGPEKTEKLIVLQKERLFLGVPGHGITVARHKKHRRRKNRGYLNKDGNEKYTPELNYSYELIIAIANSGRTDTVMNAARKAGARGGTVIHGKGTGNENAEKFYHVSIAEEKEVILIVSAASQKSEIMRSILENAGPGTPAGTVVFSLPVSEAVGFGFI